MYPGDWQEDTPMERNGDAPTEPSVVRKRYEDYRRAFIRKQVGSSKSGHDT